MTNSNKPKIIGSQSWQQLLFLHWRMPAARIQAILPKALRVQTYDGDAWLAVVPFSMEKVRPWWSPPVPGISWFLETNVRTYVQHDNGQTGVWFLSLDANHRLAVTIAQKFWHLNYRAARMVQQTSEATIRYSGSCRNVNAEYSIECRLPTNQSLYSAAEDSLEHFLLERYHLFAQKPDDSFLVGQVYHAPYQYQHVDLQQCYQTLTHSHGIPINADRPPDHVAYSPGVSVQVSALEPIE